MLFFARGRLRFCAASAILEKTKEESDGNAMLQFAIPCLLGLESLVGDEVKKLGLADVRVENGRVLCRGEERDGF